MAVAQKWALPKILENYSDETEEKNKSSKIIWLVITYQSFGHKQMKNQCKNLVQKYTIIVKE